MGSYNKNIYARNRIVMQALVKVSVFLFCTLGYIGLALPADAECRGCLCSGDPCNLCPLPAMLDVPLKSNEAELCARIREKVPPTSALPGSNEYFPSLDKSIMVCVNEGGDIIRNKQRSAEFPSRFYCKPPK
jgi:hypothetical protein